MRQLLLFVLYTHLFVACQTQATINTEEFDRYPSYQSVVNKFFSEYSISQTITVDTLFSFAKKPTGWYIHLKNSTTKEIREEQFWDKATKTWQQLSIPTIPVDSVSENIRWTNYYFNDSAFYSINLFYGYENWERDVIEILSRNTFNSTSSRNLYRLARAYSSLAAFTIWPGLRYPTERLKFDSTWDTDDISPEIINSFLNYSDSAIACYQRLLEKDPSYETFVGNIRTAFSNEYLTAYYHLKIIDEQELGERFLVANLYDSFILSYYRNLLSSCAPNTVLFTYADLDTYVLTYLQDGQRLRPDVTIVMRNYTVESRYINYLINLQPFSQRIQLQTNDKNFWVRNENTYVYYTKEEQTSTDVTMLIKRLASRQWPTGSFYEAATPPLQLKTAVRNPSYFSNYGDSILQWSITSSQVLYTDEFFFLDFFATNSLERPVMHTDFFEFYGLRDHLYLNGLGYIVSLGRKRDPEANALDLLHHFEYGDVNVLPKNSSNYSLLLSYYSSVFYTVSDDLKKEQKPELAMQCLDKYFNLFPNEVYEFNNYSFYLMYQYYKLGEFKTGDSLMLILASNAQKSLSQNLTPEKYDSTAILNTIGIINNIADAVEASGRPRDVQGKIKEVRDSMKKAYNSF